MVHVGGLLFSVQGIVLVPIFGIVKNRQYYVMQRRIERNSLSRLANPQADFSVPVKENLQGEGLSHPELQEGDITFEEVQIISWE